MFGRPKLRKDLPPIDISRKKVKGLLGGTKLVPTTKREQRAAKSKLIEQYPDRYFIDNLHEWNSIEPRDDLAWIDDLAMLDAIFED